MSITAELHDGRQLEFPDGTDPAVIQRTVKKTLADTPSAFVSTATGIAKGGASAILGGAGNAAAGAVRGAGSIGATFRTPYDLYVGNTTSIGNPEIRAAMTSALGDMGADTNSLAFKAGKFGGEVAGTAGAGGLLANGVRGAARLVSASEAAAPFASALATNGFRTGAAQSLPANLLTRTAGGGLAAGAQVGLADPEHAGIGAMIGAALPGGAKLAGMAGEALGEAAQFGARKLMSSALKPVEKARKSGDADVAVQTLLDYGINPTNEGVQKLKGLIGDLNDQISTAIKNSGAKIDREKVLNALSATREKFGAQVSPTNDLAAIEGVGADFAQSHPAELPIQLAQELKQGTYRVLKGKYGEAGSAATEAQKSLARGLKDEISTAAPEVGPLNAEESRLLKTLVVTERRALLDSNKNPVDLGSVVALASGHPGVALGSLANSTAWTKAMGARGLNALANISAPNLNALGPTAYRAIPSSARR